MSDLHRVSVSVTGRIFMRKTDFRRGRQHICSDPHPTPHPSCRDWWQRPCFCVSQCLPHDQNCTVPLSCPLVVGCSPTLVCHLFTLSAPSQSISILSLPVSTIRHTCLNPRGLNPGLALSHSARLCCAHAWLSSIVSRPDFAVLTLSVPHQPGPSPSW